MPGRIPVFLFFYAGKLGARWSAARSRAQAPGHDDSTERPEGEPHGAEDEGAHATPTQGPNGRTEDPTDGSPDPAPRFDPFRPGARVGVLPCAFRADGGVERHRLVSAMLARARCYWMLSPLSNDPAWQPGPPEWAGKSQKAKRRAGYSAAFPSSAQTLTVLSSPAVARNRSSGETARPTIAAGWASNFAATLPRARS